MAQAYMALKLDIAKVFDRVEWRYIEFIMRSLRFADELYQWIMTFITIFLYSILIYGAPVGRIKS